MFLSSPTSCFGVSSPQGEGPAWEEPAAPRDVFLGRPLPCPAFSFEMLVTGPCLLAGGYPSRVADWETTQGSGMGGAEYKEDGDSPRNL